MPLRALLLGLPDHLLDAVRDLLALWSLACRYDAHGQNKPLLVIIDGRDKPFRTELSQANYAAVRALGEEYKQRNPRSLG